jgi:hypothetical protein
MLADVIPEVPTVEEVHHEVEVLSVLERIVHVDYERVVQLSENLALVHDRLDRPLCNDSRFRHFLHSVRLLRLLTLHLPNLAEAALPYAVEVVEVRLSESLSE